MACLSCTLGLFNISRFAILSIHFGANFVLQFVFLTIVFGLPFLTLQLCLGQKLGAGVVDMWRISPLFQGVGISLLFTQVFIGLYSVVGVSWLFVYFRDSFITKIDNYRWSEPYIYYRKGMSLVLFWLVIIYYITVGLGKLIGLQRLNNFFGSNCMFNFTFFNGFLRSKISAEI